MWFNFDTINITRNFNQKGPSTLCVPPVQPLLWLQMSLLRHLTEPSCSSALSSSSASSTPFCLRRALEKMSLHFVPKRPLSLWQPIQIVSKLPSIRINPHSQVWLLSTNSTSSSSYDGLKYLKGKSVYYLNLPYSSPSISMILNSLVPLLSIDFFHFSYDMKPCTKLSPSDDV